jgi:hypothetical protein
MLLIAASAGPTTTRHPGSIWTTKVSGVLVDKSKKELLKQLSFYARHFPSSTNRPVEIESYQASQPQPAANNALLSRRGQPMNKHSLIVH